MKRINILLLTIALCITGCNDFLDTDNLVKKDSSNFPTSPEDALQALYGAYSPNFGMPADQNPVLVGEILSDDRFGGGGQNDRNPQAMNVFKVTSENHFSGAWKSFYQGIFRCNSLLASMDLITNWENETQMNKILGETHFLRAYYYFNMARMWGTVPLVIDPLPQNNPKADPEELFGQILYDLKMAIESLPATQQPKSELGRATKWAAEALMARAYLFYDGYYKANARADVQLADGSTLTSTQVIGWLEDCIKNSGHELAGDFRNQWPYSVNIPESDYKYAKDNGLNWLREEGDNKETMFATKFSILGGWDQNDNIANNQLITYQGWRDQTLTPFGQGWGFGPVNPKLYDEWPDNDLRKRGSICYVDDPAEGISGFKWGGDMMWQETGYWQKKYMPVNVKRKDSGGNEEICSYVCVLYGRASNFQTNNNQDLVYIRFADVLLMHSELTKTTDGINEVRRRAKLTPIGAYTEEALRQERRYELAFEGIRYYDLLRWYGKEAGTILKQNMTGAKIWNMGAETTINRDRNNGYFDAIDVRVRETGGFLQIPNEEISLSGGVLVQNPGWEGTSVMFN